MPITLYRCKMCRQEKQESYFYRNGDKIHANCKACLKLKRNGNGLYNKYKKRKRDDYQYNKYKFDAWFNTVPDFCYYCGMSLEDYNKIKKYLWGYKGTNKILIKFKRTLFNKGLVNSKKFTIDRLDSIGEYEIKNMVKSCWFCNHIKGGLIDYKSMKLIAKNIISSLINNIKSEKNKIIIKISKNGH